MPRSIAQMDWESSFVSVYSRLNPNLLFSICGFEVRILPISRIGVQGTANFDGVWQLQRRCSRESSAQAYVRVSDDSIKQFENRIRQVLMSSGSTTFTKIANK